MEIERKFLIQEKSKEYFSPFEISKLKKEMIKGELITQTYLKKKKLPELKLSFKPNEIRLRKINNKFYLTIKSKGSLERHEIEKEISKEVYDNLYKFKKKELKKIRLKKKYKGYTIEFDFYEFKNLITAEIEFKTIEEAKHFKTEMKEITGNKKYSNRKLAKQGKTSIPNTLK